MSLIKKVRNKLFPGNPQKQREDFAKKQSPETKVLLAGLMQSSNLGDAVIADCVSYLIRKAAKENGLRKVKITTRDIRKQKSKADLDTVRNSDLVIFPGGGMIKYQVENLPVAMERVMSRAEHYGIPVMMNSVGVEGYDGKNEGCILLRDMLSRYCLKEITCRDYADFLNEKYLGDGLCARRVSDPAVWAGEVYSISKDESSQVIGLGVARAGLFEDYGTDYSKEDALRLWSDIIRRLDERNVKWKLFTNGLPKDEEFLLELLEYIGKAGKAQEYSLQKPDSARELVHNISTFKAIIALRMHANIIAYSMGIPCVGLVWNRKLSYFGKSIGCEKRFITPEKFSSDYIMSVLDEAIGEGYSKEVFDSERESAFRSISDFFTPFAKSLLEARRRDLTNVKLVCYGLPNLESPKLNRELFENHVDYFVCDDETLVGSKCLSKLVLSTKKLKKSIGKKPFVIISETVDYTPCAKTLMEYGYKERYDFINMHAYKRYVFKKGDVFIDNPTG